MTRTSSFVVVGAVFAMLLIAACTTATQSDSQVVVSSAHEPIIGGDAGSPYNTGALILGSISPQGCVGLCWGCTGVMIGPNQVLTAAHCVVQPIPTDAGPPMLTTTLRSEYQPGQSLTLSNSPVIGASPTVFTSVIQGTDLPPDFQAQCVNGCYPTTYPYPQDLAIVTLAQTLPQSFGLASEVASAAVSEPVTEVGYGCTQSAYVMDPGPRTFKFAPATLVDPSGVVPLPGQANPTAFGQNYYATLGQKGGGVASICPGDSGGPLFKGGLGPPLARVVGINSLFFLVPNDDSGISFANVFARLDSPNATNFISTTLSKYAAPAPQTDRGDPVNSSNDPISGLFPVETVSLETPGKPGCTGVVLTRNSILTSAHCQVGSSTIAHFYYNALLGGLDAGSNLPGPTISGVSVVTPPGVTCDPADVTNYPANCFTSTGTTGAYHDADLAVLTLAAPISEDWMPVVLGPRGFAWQNSPGDSGPLPVWWEVAAGGPMPIGATSPLMWAPVTPVVETSGQGLAQGWFFISSTYAEWNDTGGPVFQAPSATFVDDAGADGGGLFLGSTTLVGIVSSMGNCPDGVFTCSRTDTVVSVTFPDNYDWLTSLGGLPVPQLATFGAAR